MENQPNLSERKEDMSYAMTGKCGQCDLENVDWQSELRLEGNNINLSSELLINKVDRLINFWSHFLKISNKRKKTLNKSWMTKGIMKSIGIKNSLFKKLCCLKDPLKKRQLEIKLKNHYKIFFRLMQNSKSNDFNSYVHENKLNLFKRWEDIREVINISRKRKN